jgi:outer membrane biosynthesis protein TonB
MESTPPLKQSTTFRTAACEISATDMRLQGKGRTKFAVIGGVALVAAGIAAAVLLTRPTPSKEVPASSTATAPAPPIPEIDPPTLAVPQPNEPVHFVEPVPLPPNAVEEPKHHKKNPAGKNRKPGPESEAPGEQASPSTNPAKNTERW